MVYHTMITHMEIDITKAIEQRKDEIERLKALKPKIERLALDAKAAERGEACMRESDWRKLRDEIQEEMYRLGLARLERIGPCLPSVQVGIPSSWSSAEVW